ncbi:MAG: site-specific DNA-methyltransferase [Clostridia bacterium]|nr:site-specific DNA-methyltransferase [Clostridia bacterium]
MDNRSITETVKSSSVGRFVLGDALNVMEGLASTYTGRIQLVYLDPPVVSNATHCIRSRSSWKSAPYEVYDDFSTVDDYKLYLSSVLRLCKELLSPSGALYLHTTPALSSVARQLLDAVFGSKCFVNELIWTYRLNGRSTRRFASRHDTILLYGASKEYYMNLPAAGTTRGIARRNHMKRSIDADGRIYFSVRTRGKEYRYYEDSLILPGDVWDDIDNITSKHPEHTGYPSQRPAELLKRMVLASTNANDIVLDAFSGSGTLAVTADSIGRRWICADTSPAAAFTLKRRLLQRDMPIYETSHSAEFHTNTAMLDAAKLSFEVTQRGEQTSVKIDAASSAVPLIFAEYGELAGDRFLPYSYAERKGDHISIPLINTAAVPCIQLTTTAFKQYYVTLK